MSGAKESVGSMSDSKPNVLSACAVDEFNRFSCTYLHLIEPRIDGTQLRVAGLRLVATHQLRPSFTGSIIISGGFERDSTQQIVEGRDEDLTTFGRYFA